MMDAHSFKIRELDYSVVEFACALEGLFRFAVDPSVFQITGEMGVEVELEDHKGYKEARAHISPARWPSESGVFVRLCRVGGVWKVFEGHLIARHLPEEFSEFHFRCDGVSGHPYKFGGIGTKDEVLLKRLLAARVAAETEIDR